MTRLCYICGTEINACMGYVSAGDFVSYEQRKTQNVREICGKDVERLELYASRNNLTLENVLEDLFGAKSQ
ncbi:MAG: hypothetical protein AABX88_02440 [Nanoarchaeota archaeon]